MGVAFKMQIEATAQGTTALATPVYPQHLLIAQAFQALREGQEGHEQPPGHQLPAGLQQQLTAIHAFGRPDAQEEAQLEAALALTALTPHAQHGRPDVLEEAQVEAAITQTAPVQPAQ